jgi:hypothetical protein
MSGQRQMPCRWRLASPGGRGSVLSTGVKGPRPCNCGTPGGLGISSMSEPLREPKRSEVDIDPRVSKSEGPSVCSLDHALAMRMSRCAVARRFDVPAGSSPAWRASPVSQIQSTTCTLLWSASRLSNRSSVLYSRPGRTGRCPQRADHAARRRRPASTVLVIVSQAPLR